MINYKFQIFGSASSQDVDVMVFVKKLKSIDENHTLIKYLNKHYKTLFIGTEYEGKEINTNLAIVKNGMIIDVFKGTYDECNNSLKETYSYHKQYHKNVIFDKYDRIQNKFYHWKMKRVLRFILSFYSRVPELRTDIKSALRGDFKERLRVCKLLDLTINTEFPNKKEPIEDIYKVIAFQLVQIISLSEQIEVYSKEHACIQIPKLAPFINRKQITEKDLKWLQFYFNHLLNISNSEMNSMEYLQEELK
jgi:hypothetical protein